MIAALLLAAAIGIPPRPTDYVTDYAGALSMQTARRVDTELRSYEQITKHHVIVWIGQTTGDSPLEDWTIHAAERWKIGRKGVDDGVILFLFVRDHKVRIEVGYGLESTLPDATAGEIIRNTIVPRMRAGDVDGAVQGGTDRILQTISPSFAVQISRSAPIANEHSVTTDIVIFVVVFGFILLFVSVMTFALISTRRRGAWYPGGTDSRDSSSDGETDGGGSDSGSSGGSFGGGGASGSW